MNPSGKHEPISTCSDWRDQYVNEQLPGVQCWHTLNCGVGNFILGSRQADPRPSLGSTASLEHGTLGMVPRYQKCAKLDQELGKLEALLPFLLVRKILLSSSFTTVMQFGILLRSEHHP